jgi:hypothetical protein
MDWCGRNRKIVPSMTLLGSAALPARVAVRFERLEFVWIRLMLSRFQPI